jgi:hypothetical protein
MKNNNTYGYGFKSSGSKGWYSLNAFQWRKTYSYQPRKDVLGPKSFTMKVPADSLSY